MKCKLLKCRKTSRSKDAVIQVEVVLLAKDSILELVDFPTNAKK